MFFPGIATCFSCFPAEDFKKNADFSGKFPEFVELREVFEPLRQQKQVVGDEIPPIFHLIVSECFIGDQNPGKRQKRAAMSVRTNFSLNSLNPNFSNFSRSGYSASRKILSEICQNSHRFKTEKLTAREKAHPHVRRESVFRGKALDFFLLWFIVILAVIAAAGRGYRFGGLSGTASSA